MTHWPPRRGYIYYRLKRLMTPHPDVTSRECFNFATFIFSSLRNYIVLILGYRSAYIDYTILILIIVALNVGTRILSHLRFSATIRNPSSRSINVKLYFNLFFWI